MQDGADVEEQDGAHQGPLKQTQALFPGRLTWVSTVHLQVTTITVHSHTNCPALQCLIGRQTSWTSFMSHLYLKHQFSITSCG